MVKKIRARFCQGKIAKDDLVYLLVGKNELAINYLEENKQCIWLYQDITSLPKPIKKEGVLFLNKKYPNAQLFVEDYQKAKLIIDKTSFKADRLRTFFKISAFSLSILIILIILAKLLSFLVLKYLPQAIEKDIGGSLFDNIIKEKEICQNKAANKAINKMLQQLQSQIKSNWNYEIKVIKEEYSNAISLPGGYVILFHKLIEEIESKEELYYILSHEIAHVENRHSLKSSSKAIVTHNIISAITQSDSAAYLIRLIFDLENSRKEELEADTYSINILNKMGINIDGAIDFFERIDNEAHYITKSFQYISTHPMPDQRIKNIKKYSKPSKNSKKLISNKEWRSIKSICN